MSKNLVYMLTKSKHIYPFWNDMLTFLILIHRSSIGLFTRKSDLGIRWFTSYSEMANMRVKTLKNSLIGK